MIAVAGVRLPRDVERHISGYADLRRGQFTTPVLIARNAVLAEAGDAARVPSLMMPTVAPVDTSTIQPTLAEVIVDGPVNGLSLVPFAAMTHTFRDHAENPPELRMPPPPTAATSSHPPSTIFPRRSRPSLVADIMKHPALELPPDAKYSLPRAVAPTADIYRAALAVTPAVAQAMAFDEGRQARAKRRRTIARSVLMGRVLADVRAVVSVLLLAARGRPAAGEIVARFARGQLRRWPAWARDAFVRALWAMPLIQDDRSDGTSKLSDTVERRHRKIVRKVSSQSFVKLSLSGANRVSRVCKLVLGCKDPCCTAKAVSARCRAST